MAGAAVLETLLMVQGAPAVPEAALLRQREVVKAFLAASREGNFDALLAVLDPEVVLRADTPIMGTDGLREVRGARSVVGKALGYGSRGQFSRLALVNGVVGAIVAPRGQLLLALRFTVIGDKVAGIEVITEPSSLRQLDLAVVDA